MSKKSKTELATVPQNGGESSLMRMIDRMTTDPNCKPETVLAMLDVQQKWEANEARKAFVAAMAEFKAEALTITKNKRVTYKTDRGTTQYDHATLDNVTDVLVPALSKHGFSHRFDVAQSNGTITVSCILTHVLGHSERTTMTAGPDKSGSKNDIQAIGSTVTYLQRYTLLAATGLAVGGTDDDGKGGKPETITPDQVAEIESLVAESANPEATRSAILRIAQVEKIADMHPDDYQKVVPQLKAAKAKKEGALL